MSRNKKPPFSGPFAQEIDDSDLRRERQKARELRQTTWWKRKIARGACHWCGRPTAPAELTMDHVVPIARGGRSVKGNVVAACKECNTKKKQLLPTEWARWLASVEQNDEGNR